MALFIIGRIQTFTQTMWLLAIAIYGTFRPLVRYKYGCSRLLLIIYQGSFIVLIDMLVFMNGPGDLFDIPKLKERIFGSFWLRVGTFSPSMCLAHYDKKNSLELTGAISSSRATVCRPRRRNRHTELSRRSFRCGDRARSRHRQSATAVQQIQSDENLRHRAQSGFT